MNVLVCGQGSTKNQREGERKKQERREDQAHRTKRSKSGGGSHSRRRGGERRKRVTLAVLISRKGEGREAGEAASGSTGDEGAPSADPGLGGRRVGQPGIVGGVNDVLLTPSTSESRASSELDEMVDAGDSVGGVRSRSRRVRTVVLATLQESAVSAGRDDRTDITLRERSRRARDTPSEAEKDAEGEVA